MKARSKQPIWFPLIFIGLCLVGWLTGGRALAQEDQPRLTLTGAEVTSPPLVELHAYGMDTAGVPLNMNQQPLVVRHDGVPASPVEVTGSYEGGTFTLFLIDIPAGVADQLPTIEAAIKQYASPETMSESVDAVAVYKIGETAATELLAPDSFHNSVRNLFATPLAPETGATALIDSLVGLLEQVEGLKPRAEMFASFVVISDGTDVVSTQYQPEDVAATANRLGIPVHTIWLTNENLIPDSQAFGRDYLTDLAADTRGLTADLQNEGEVAAIWSRIAAFREQARVQYPLPNLAGGDFPVTLSLEGTAVSAETTVTVPGTLPTITITLPPESRSLALPDLEEPVELRFTTEYGWLDDEARSLVAAQLVVNGATYDVPVDEIDQFEVAVDNLIFGVNTVQIAVLDSLGQRVTSPAIQLEVTEGAEEIPSALEPGGGWGVVLLLLFVVLLFAAAVFLAWRVGLLGRLGEMLPRGPSSRVRPGPREPGPTRLSPNQTPLARIEVLEAVTRTADHFPLYKTAVRIGRSPQQCDISFENDITVSRLHATLYLENNRYRIYDERSTSGTWVNEQQVPEYGIELQHGDEIHLGAVHLRFLQP